MALTTHSTYLDPKSQGMHDAREGLSIDQNPYESGSKPAEDWEIGFLLISGEDNGRDD